MIRVERMEEHGGCMICKDNHLTVGKLYYKVISEVFGKKSELHICKRCLDDINFKVAKIDRS